MGLSVPRDEFLVIIALQTLKKIARDQPSRYTGVKELVKNRQHSNIKHQQNTYNWIHEATI